MRRSIIQKSIRNILFAMILLYFAQGSLYPSGSLFAKSVLFVYLFISLLYAVLFMFEYKKDNIGLVLIVFIFINIVYWLIGDKEEVQIGQFSVSPFGQMKNILVALLTYFPFYFFSTKKYLTEKSLVVFYILFFIFSILTFFATDQSMRDFTKREEVVNNSSYLFLSIIPVSLVFWRRKYLFIISYVLTFIFIFLALKRGPIIGVMLITIIIFYYWWKLSIRQLRIGNILSILIVFISILYLGIYLVENNAFLQNRFQSMLEGSSSGRDVIYSVLFNKWFYSDNMINLFFGYGFFASAHIAGIVAHNDWLEIVTSLGLMGGTVYAIFYFILINLILMNNKWSIQDKTMLSVIFAVLLIKSIVSMGYTSIDTTPVMMCLAYLSGKNLNLDVRRRLYSIIPKKQQDQIKINLSFYSFQKKK